MVVNGSKSGKKPLLPFFFELWSNNKKTAEKHKIMWLCRRFYEYRALSLFGVEHVLDKDEVTSSNLVISSKKNVPYNEGRFFGAGGHLPRKRPLQRGVFFWSRGASPPKALPTKRSAFFFRCVSSPSKTFLTTRDVFFGAGGHLRQNHPLQRGTFF